MYLFKLLKMTSFNTIELHGRYFKGLSSHNVQVDTALGQFGDGIIIIFIRYSGARTGFLWALKMRRHNTLYNFISPL